MKKQNCPLVSVIIPAYNMEKLIGKTLKSVIKQTYQNIEIIVIDDGSKDRTTTVVKQLIEQDNRIKLLQQKNLGVAVARNRGIEIAKGEFIAPIDADDLWYPENLERQVQCIKEANLDVGLVYSWSLDIDENDFPTGGFKVSEIEGNVYPTLVCNNFLGNASCCLMRRNVVEKIGGYSLEFKKQNAQGCEDWDLYLKIAANYQFKVVRDFLVGYRQLKDSMSGNYETMTKSHVLLLNHVRNTSPNLPEFLYGFSKSNLYLYFAHQSYLYRDYQTTLSWIKQAIKAESFFISIRPKLYYLIIFSYWKIFKAKLEAKKTCLNSNNILGNHNDLLTVYAPKKMDKISIIKLKLTLLMSNIFKQFITFIYKATQKKKLKVDNARS